MSIPPRKAVSSANQPLRSSLGPIQSLRRDHQGKLELVQLKAYGEQLQWGIPERILPAPDSEGSTLMTLAKLHRGVGLSLASAGTARAGLTVTRCGAAQIVAVDAFDTKLTSRLNLIACRIDLTGVDGGIDGIVERSATTPEHLPRIKAAGACESDEAAGRSLACQVAQEGLDVVIGKPCEGPWRLEGGVGKLSAWDVGMQHGFERVRRR
ncbi:hypothetical protein BDK51DRAFT_47837 [Blyttiomyces helicus]|uniref:Uncharacterized protein n=1 Tax=Blyttiomyces helicus TaxID=388810 RepID=A0A4P9W2K4_9FUNG|nr:hypothetical protein BDK51DRAFT_47837 [Blyttiomyces helicus]|eukprot:RKO85605.1 hypothetical protein BDK51DRAFT_47837 [Blyttiomyces helicus]